MGGLEPPPLATLLLKINEQAKNNDKDKDETLLSALETQQQSTNIFICPHFLFVPVFLFWQKKLYLHFYFPSSLGQETAKGLFRLQIKLSPAHLSTTHGGGFTFSLFLAKRQAGKQR